MASDRTSHWPEAVSSTTLSGNNTYSGGTYFDYSTLRVTGGSALPDNGEVQLSNGATLEVLTEVARTRA